MRNWSTSWSRDWDEAERGVELMRAESDGRVTFLVNDGRTPPPLPGNFDQIQKSPDA